MQEDVTRSAHAGVVRPPRSASSKIVYSSRDERLQVTRGPTKQMNESDARSALLVRAYETAPANQAGHGWTEDDRAWATQAALRAEGEGSKPDDFIARRARLAAERIFARDRDAALVSSALTWRAWIGWALVLLAFAAGVATDAIGPAQRINVLAPPLIAVLGWNLAVYAAIVARALARLAGTGAKRPGPFARGIAHAAGAAASSGRMEAWTPLLAGFARDWAAAGAALTAARIARVLHSAAAAFAAGALSGMYLRGFALEYRAVWESTFLDASSVHAILSAVLEPAAAITGIALPDQVALAAIRSSVSPRENAAPWIHLYGMTIVLYVLVPRALMALAQFFAERRLTRHFPLSIGDAYFQSLARAQRGEAAKVRVLPYSYRLEARAQGGLKALFARVLGAGTEVVVLPAVPFGGEDAHDPSAAFAAPVALVAALFSLAATPERENHGAFAAALRAQLPPSVPIAALVDESAFRQRFGADDASDAGRRDERRAAWQRVLAEAGCAAVFVDLEGEESAGAERDLRAALERAAERAPRD